ncbi:MAG: hypothetical protein Fur0037_28750 [Planctomycetota bacterium]
MLGASFDEPEANAAFAAKFSLPYRLLCDTDRSLAIAYEAARSPQDRHPRRITYVIGKDGKIEQAIETRDKAGQAAAILASIADRGPLC